jgi:hypothetical protein
MTTRSHAAAHGEHGYASDLPLISRRRLNGQ